MALANAIQKDNRRLRSALEKAKDALSEIVEEGIEGTDTTRFCACNDTVMTSDSKKLSKHSCRFTETLDVLNAVLGIGDDDYIALRDEIINSESLLDAMFNEQEDDGE